MRSNLCVRLGGLVLAAQLGLGLAAESNSLTLHIRAAERAPHQVPRFITGKFAEHLGFNIYHGMDAQVLRNPTFADFPIWSGQMSPDGLTWFHHERERITEDLRRRGTRQGYPEPELAALTEAYFDGLAASWTRVGTRAEVEVSPDTTPGGQRAQRVEIKQPNCGIAQWSYLPLHRVREFEFELYLRSPDLTNIVVALEGPDNAGANPVSLTGISTDWQRFRGRLLLAPSVAADSRCRFTLTARQPGQLVIGRAQLWPADHLRGADPEVVRYLRESRLPILRWPGGNFVSAYRWEDGIGPVEQRPTRPNYAWGGVEPNLFGTAEFIAFCRSVGCEPMICINAGTATPAEAARWIEYCNGPVTTPQGRLRAAHGYPEPFAVQHWEIGNELWGRWQAHWTTARGYVDRFHQFRAAMLSADSNITLYACGAPVMWGKNWNDQLIAGTASVLQFTTDHPLVGGNVPRQTDPLAVFRDFMAVPQVLEQKWAALEKDMLQAGIRSPRLAVTELQMFAHLGGTEPGAPVRLGPTNLVNPGTLAEALYDVLVYHAVVRLGSFGSMVTHSATVNHGGGLRKERERVYANPCHYAQAAFRAFAGATPVLTDGDAPREPAPRVLPELRNAVQTASYPTLGTLAALTPDGALLVSLVHTRGEPSPLNLRWRDFAAADEAEVWTLSGAVPWAANTLERPSRIAPRTSRQRVSGDSLSLSLEPYSVVQVRLFNR